MQNTRKNICEGLYELRIEGDIFKHINNCRNCPNINFMGLTKIKMKFYSTWKSTGTKDKDKTVRALPPPLAGQGR